MEVAKALALPLAADAGFRVGDVAQARRFGGFDGIRDDFEGV
jgi:hypothetical protein